jgi:diguanylate cyclase (GGDEF)-like protein
MKIKGNENPTHKREPAEPTSRLEKLLVQVNDESLARDLEDLIGQAIMHEKRARLTAETLQRATAALNSTLDLNQVLDLILEQLQKVVYYDSASLMLAEGEILRILAVRGHPHPEEALNLRFSSLQNRLANEIFTARKTLILADAQTDARYQGFGNSDHVRGWMGVPIAARDEIIGILTLDNRKPDAYTQEDARLAMIFASQAALAIANARIYESERKQRAVAQALHEISLALSSTLRSDEILNTILEQVEHVVPYDSMSLFMLEGDTVRVVAHRGYERYGVVDLIEDLRISVQETPNLRTMTKTHQPHFVSNVKKNENWIEMETSQEIGSWVGAPLVAHDRLLGFLSLDKVESGYYRHEHACNLEMLAGHAALALLNAETFGEVEEASITDYLTGAYNHRYFYHQLSREISNARSRDIPTSLLMMDIDIFKDVNDRYGHLCGDQVLKQLANRLKSELRTIDHLARYGGEEFTAILPGTSAESMKQVAERLRRAVAAHPFHIYREASNRETIILPLTISIGGSTYPVHGQTSRELVSSADRALYQAKSAGRNCVRIAR